MSSFEKFLEEIDPKIMVATMLSDVHDKVIKNGKQDLEKFSKYCKAIRLLKQLLVQGRGKAKYDDVNESLSYHMVTVEFFEDEFNSEETKLLSTIIGLFDSIMLLADQSNGNVSFMLMMENIYTTE